MQQVSAKSAETRLGNSGERPRIVIYLGYHKTGSKWIWKHFFTGHYASLQVNLFEPSSAELRDSGGDAPLVLRQRIESGLMGGELAKKEQKQREKS